LRKAEEDGDLLDMAEVAVDQLYPLIAEKCPGETTDQLREIGVTWLMLGGASHRMSLEAQRFLDDLARHGLATSPRAGRLLFMLSREAELAGRIPDAFAFATGRCRSCAVRRPATPGVSRSSCCAMPACRRRCRCVDVQR